MNAIKTLDRKYNVILKAMKLVTSNIAKLATKPNTSITIEMSVAQTARCQSYQHENREQKMLYSRERMTELEID